MKRSLSRFEILALCILSVVVFATVTSTRAASPESDDLAATPAAPRGVVTTAFTYQGQLIGAAGPVNAACDFQFGLWDAAAAGTQLGITLTPTLNVANGLFTAPLDFGDQFTGDERWLEIAVQCPGDPGFTLLDPRVPLVGVPYANGVRPGVTVIDSGSASSAAIAAPGYGITGASPGYGVYGTSDNVGVAGNSTSGTGVLGQTQASLQAAVKGINDAADGIGVRGEANAAGSVGVWGQSNAHTGVYGLSIDGTGVGGQSQSGSGVLGVSTSGDGISGQSTSGAGVLATSTDYYGVLASSVNSSGVYGSAGAIYQAGVKGINDASSGIGVWGEANAAGGVGVWGQSNANTGIYGVSVAGRGVWGSSTSGTGVYGYSATGLAGLFEGRVRVNVLEIAGGSDLAERFRQSDMVQAEPGTVMAIDADHPGHLKVSNSAYDGKVAGIVSGAGDVRTGLTLQQTGVMEGELTVAIAGRVYARCEALSAPIRPGDLLTTSTVPGTCMKAADRSLAHGAVIGKAMTALDTGRGLVLVLVNLQ